MSFATHRTLTREEENVTKVNRGSPLASRRSPDHSPESRDLWDESLRSFCPAVLAERRFAFLSAPRQLWSDNEQRTFTQRQ